MKKLILLAGFLFSVMLINAQGLTAEANYPGVGKEVNDSFSMIKITIIFFYFILGSWCFTIGLKASGLKVANGTFAALSSLMLGASLHDFGNYTDNPVAVVSLFSLIGLGLTNFSAHVLAYFKVLGSNKVVYIPYIHFFITMLIGGIVAFICEMPILISTAIVGLTFGYWPLIRAVFLRGRQINQVSHQN